uniref:hypothetical protein n=1 Tax=Yoonia sp. TaxID=2212373 RepID=UPI0040470924
MKDNEKTGPNWNGRGSPKLRLRAIQSPTLARRRVYEVRSVHANPFDNTEKSVPVRAVSLVRNGDNGGGSATAVEPSLPLTHWNYLSYRYPPVLQATDRISLTARGLLKTQKILSDQNPVVGGARLKRGIAVFGHSLRLVSRIMMRTLPPFAVAAIAGAALPRICSNVHFAAQRISPNQPFGVLGFGPILELATTRTVSLDQLNKTYAAESRSMESPLLFA